MDQDNTDYELLELQNEIDRHHQLITWMCIELDWACRFAENSSSEAKVRVKEIRQRLNREVRR